MNVKMVWVGTTNHLSSCLLFVELLQWVEKSLLGQRRSSLNDLKKAVVNYLAHGTEELNTADIEVWCVVVILKAERLFSIRLTTVLFFK